MKETSVTIISTNINKHILDNYKNYHVVERKFKIDELLNYKKVIFFNVLHYYDDEKIKEIFKTLEDNNIKYINFTNNIEEALYTSYLIIYDDKKVLVEGVTDEVLKCEKLIKKVGLNLPFITELSLLLKDYDLVDKIYKDNASLKGDLWK